MSKALYRKYRSKKLSEIVGQEHITRTLENALKTGKLSHAYLFTGPKGVGKTSVARILAHEINKLPYTDESMHLDIIEIDAASNRRIDEIRDIREKVHVAPTSAKYKVYIIDEVHMLTKEAFNALLKTLEEPPAHVVFILATTELHKLPETIISRTQRFTFKPIDPEKAVEHLKSIAKTEGINIDNDALKLIVEHSSGSFRDSISMLDQIGHSRQKVSRKDAEAIVGIASAARIVELEKAIFDGTPADIANSLSKLSEEGISPAQAAKQLSAILRHRLISGDNNQLLPELLKDLLSVSASSEPSAALEIALFVANMKLIKNSDPIAVSVSEHSQFQPEINNKPATQTENAEESVEPPVAEPSHSLIDIKDMEVWWGEVLHNIKAFNNTLYGVLRMAVPKLEEDVLRLSFGFGFHQKKAADAATQSKILKAVENVTGKNLKIVAVHDPSLSTPKSVSASKQNKATETQTDSNLESVKNVFGGGEVLES